MGDSVNLDEIAEQELLNEAKRGAARASVYGALGWQKCPLKPTNKIFLQNILLSTISSKRREPDSGIEKDSMKRKLTDFVVKHSGSVKKLALTEKKSVPEEGCKVEDVHNHKELSKSRRKSDEQVRTSSRKKNNHCSSSVSVVVSHRVEKHKQEYHNKQVVSSKYSDNDNSFTRK